MVLTCETKVQRLAAGRIIVRDEEGRLALSSFRFFPWGGQAALGAKQPILCKRFGRHPIRTHTDFTADIDRLGEEALELPGDVTLRVSWIG